jgi:ComF family protein
MFKALQNSFLSIIYPQECRVCGLHVESVSDGVCCGECWAKTRIFCETELVCDKCGAFFADQAAPVRVHCQQCDDHFYDKAAAIGVYENALAASVINLKSTPYLPSRIMSAIPNALQRADFATSDVIIPIPLSKHRKLERGFNQAEVIAKAIARSTGMSVDGSSLARKLHTPIHRVGMDQKARELTVKNAFEVVRPKLIEGKSILLVDDVLTSGATASACANSLKKYGANRVNVFTLARAVMH